MEHVQPRYEFRVWGGVVDAAADRLRALAGGPVERARSSETYVVAVRRPDINTKIRAGLLDVKVLRRVVDDCEQWSLWAKTDFPIAAALLEAVLGRLGADEADLDRAVYDHDQFMELVAGHPALRVVRVEKVREKFVIGACLAEVSDVTVDGPKLRTLAIESVQVDAVAAMRRRLGLENEPNVNYPDAIKEAVGLNLDEAV